MAQCMFCEKEIKDNEESIFSPFNDGTDAHKSCADNALEKILENKK